MVSYVGGLIWDPGCYCCRVGIGTEGGGVLVILFKNHSKSENKLISIDKFTAQVKMIHYILFFIGGK